MSQMLLRQAVNSSHPGEMPSSLRSQVGQIAIWGSGGGPSGGEEERIKTKESERKRQKGQGAEAAFRERRRATQELKTHFSGCLHKSLHPLDERKRSAVPISLHVWHLWLGRTSSDTHLALRNTVPSWERASGSTSAAHAKDHDHDSRPTLGCRFPEAKGHHWHICVSPCLSCLKQRSFINICYSNKGAKIECKLCNFIMSYRRSKMKCLTGVEKLNPSREGIYFSLFHFSTCGR